MSLNNYITYVLWSIVPDVDFQQGGKNICIHQGKQKGKQSYKYKLTLSAESIFHYIFSYNSLAFQGCECFFEKKWGESQ